MNLHNCFPETYWVNKWIQKKRRVNEATVTTFGFGKHMCKKTLGWSHPCKILNWKVSRPRFLSFGQLPMGFYGLEHKLSHLLIHTQVPTLAWSLKCYYLETFWFMQLPCPQFSSTAHHLNQDHSLPEWLSSLLGEIAATVYISPESLATIRDNMLFQSVSICYWSLQSTVCSYHVKPPHKVLRGLMPFLGDKLIIITIVVINIILAWVSLIKNRWGCGPCIYYAWIIHVLLLSITTGRPHCPALGEKFPKCFLFI